MRADLIGKTWLVTSAAQLSGGNISLSLEISRVLYTFDLMSILWYYASSSMHSSCINNSLQSFHYWSLLSMALVLNIRSFPWWISQGIQICQWGHSDVIFSVAACTDGWCGAFVLLGGGNGSFPSGAIGSISVWMILYWEATPLVGWIFYSWYTWLPSLSGPGRPLGFLAVSIQVTVSLCQTTFQHQTVHELVASAEVVILCGLRAQPILPLM